jgi:hypothetical protein
MLSRLAIKSRYYQFCKSITQPIRSFAASNFDGMQQASVQDNENMTLGDIDVGNI